VSYDGAERTEDPSMGALLFEEQKIEEEFAKAKAAL
jgi:hypothetical protein